MPEINKSQLKTYATGARVDFIQAVKEKAAKFGIFADHIVPAQHKGDVLIIDHLAYSAQIVPAYNKVLAMIDNLGYEETVNEIAYTWFNRMIALRYMELHNLLSHGYKVIGDTRPEILEHADHVSMQGLDSAKVTDYLLAGNKDEELYAYLLTTQLSELNKTLPFLFEKIDDATNLLMPDNLLATDSVRAKMAALDKDNFEQIEVIGWLYQFYISDVKDKLMEAGKAYKKEEIPAVTQLFTPNWIVKYMVQNSLGAKWLETYPNSPLKNKMEYYIEPAEQTAEVQAQLDKIKAESIKPEEIKILDPACGSGHILVEAYDLLKEIYTEKGYNRRDIPELIIRNNLYGIDLDKRAAQLAYFALAMKACSDNPRLLEKEMKLHILCMEESNKLNFDVLCRDLLDDSKLSVSASTLKALFENFVDAKTYGSLIKVCPEVVENLDKLSALIEEGLLSHNIFKKKAALDAKIFVEMAEFLATKYDCVVANPPYMGSKGQSALLKAFLSDKYKQAKSDLFSAFILQNLHFSKDNGCLGFMTPFVWMFISSYEELRNIIIQKYDLSSLVQLEYSGFDGATVPICTFTLTKNHIKNKKGCFIKLSDFRGAQNQAPRTLEAIKNRKCGWFYEANSTDFSKIPGTPIAYWVSENILRIFSSYKTLENYAEIVTGISTGKNDLYLRYWHEIDRCKSELHGQNLNSINLCKQYWLPYNKGGEARKWYGNNDFVVKWCDNQKFHRSRPMFQHLYLKEGITWSFVTSGLFTARYYPQGHLWDVAGSPCVIKNSQYLTNVLSYLSTPIVQKILAITNPTLNCQVIDIQRIPIKFSYNEKIGFNGGKCISISKTDWDSFETSWDFEKLPLLQDDLKKDSLAASYQTWRTQNAADIAETLALEEENNRLFIEAYGLQDEITPEVPIEQITLTINPRYRYKNTEASDDELEARFKADSMKELISYAIGCMMGRYSLDKTGLVYANEKGDGFNSDDYTTFAADDDGIIPVTDFAWFPEQDVVNRLTEFVEKIWGKTGLEDNMRFIAEALDKKPTETSTDAIRRYMTKDFYKNHLQMYKNRPIYWLFSSGKEKAFECLVYLHRMNERTLARIRMQFIVPLMSKLEAALNNIETAINSASSIAERRTLEKQKDKWLKQLQELRDYDDALNHAINARIEFDLDDGVKVNYGKFGSLLAESKKIVGNK